VQHLTYLGTETPRKRRRHVVEKEKEKETEGGGPLFGFLFGRKILIALQLATGNGKLKTGILQRARSKFGYLSFFFFAFFNEKAACFKRFAAALRWSSKEMKK